MRHGSLFSGIGGFDLASEWMGWTNVFHCEINEFCRKVLKQHFPDAATYTDITTTDFTEWKGRCDIVTGGFPCQPYSQAGKRKGKADDRHLWPQMLRAIKQIQPAWIVGENVPGLLNWKRGMVLAEIIADLEAAGFEVFPPVILPACGKNAPHRRDRLWVIAHSKEFGREQPRDTRNGRTGFEDGNIVAAYTESSESRKQTKWKRRQNITGGIKNNDGASGKRNTAPDTNGNIGCEGGLHQTEQQTAKRYVGSFNSCSNRSAIWDNFPTQPPVCGRNDGVSFRVDRIKALGNSIVPQVAYEIFKAIESINS